MKSKIDLEKLDQWGDDIVKLFEALGVGRKKIKELIKRITKNPPETLMQKLGLNSQEIKEAYEKSKSLPQAIARIWKNKGKTEISLETAVATILLLVHQYEKYRQFNPPLLEIILVPLSLLREVELLEEKCAQCAFFNNCLIRVLIEALQPGMIPPEEKIMSMLKEMVKKNGTEVQMDSQECHLWLEEHRNSCQGCSSELGCKKMALLGAILDGLKDATIEKIENILESLNILTEKILKAQSLSELDEICTKKI